MSTPRAALVFSPSTWPWPHGQSWGSHGATRGVACARPRLRPRAGRSRAEGHSWEGVWTGPVPGPWLVLKGQIRSRLCLKHSREGSALVFAGNTFHLPNLKFLNI